MQPQTQNKPRKFANIATITFLVMLVAYLSVGIPIIVQILNSMTFNGEQTFWNSSEGAVTLTVFVPFVLIVLAVISAIWSFIQSLKNGAKVKSGILLIITLCVVIPILLFAAMIMMI